MSRALHLLAVEQGTTLQALMGEAFDDLMRKYGNHPFGERSFRRDTPISVAEHIALDDRLPSPASIDVFFPIVIRPHAGAYVGAVHLDPTLLKAQQLGKRALLVS